MPLAQHTHGDVLEALASEASVELLESQLGIDPDQLGELSERPLLFIRLGDGLVCQGAKSLTTLPLLADTASQRAIHTQGRRVRTVGFHRRRAHATTL